MGGEEEPKIADVMTKDVMAVDLNTSVKSCAKSMAKKGVSCAVITQSNAPIGIVTERDLVSKVLADAIDPNYVLVRDVMSTPLITVTPRATTTEASAMMAEYRIRRLVVVDNGAMVGIVTTGDIARSLAEQHGYREVVFNAMARYKEGNGDGPYQ
jgi:signal-transduction protein with cAMP-binding, CBS, and nucleotidyltransferase domain